MAVRVVKKCRIAEGGNFEIGLLQFIKFTHVGRHGDNVAAEGVDRRRHPDRPEEGHENLKLVLKAAK